MDGTTAAELTPTLRTPPAGAALAFHLLATSSGSTRNIDCTYCFFLSKKALYRNDKQRMSRGEQPPKKLAIRNEGSATMAAREKHLPAAATPLSDLACTRAH